MRIVDAHVATPGVKVSLGDVHADNQNIEVIAVFKEPGNLPWVFDLYGISYYVVEIGESHKVTGGIVSKDVRGIL